MRNNRGYTNRNPFHGHHVSEMVPALSVKVDIVTEVVESLFKDIDSIRLLYDVTEFEFGDELKLNDPLITQVLLNADFPSKIELTIYDENQTVLKHYRTSGKKIRVVQQIVGFHTRVILLVNERLRKRNLDNLYQVDELTGSILLELNKAMIGLLDQL